MEESQLIKDITEITVDVESLKILKKQAKITLDELKAYVNNTFNSKLSISSFNKIFSSVKSSNIEKKSNREIAEIIKSAEEEARDKQNQQARKQILEKIFQFQHLLSTVLGQEIVLTWVYVDDDGKEKIMTYSSAAEEDILVNASGYGKVSLRQSAAKKTTGTDLTQYLQSLVQDEDTKKIIENHIKIVKAINDYIKEKERLVSTTTTSTNKKGQSYSKSHLFLWWKEAEKRIYGYVNNYGFYYEGYVGALVNYQSRDFENINDLENKIKVLYTKYILNVDNLAGMWGGDIVTNLFNDNNLNVQLAVKYGNASSQSFSILYRFMRWISEQSDSSLENLSKKGLYNAFYEDLNKNRSRPLGIVSTLLKNVKIDITKQLKEDLSQSGINFTIYKDET